MDDHFHFKNRMRGILGNIEQEIGLAKGGILSHLKSPREDFTVEDVFTFSVSTTSTPADLIVKYQRAYPKATSIELVHGEISLNPERPFEAWAIEPFLCLQARLSKADDSVQPRTPVRSSMGIRCDSYNTTPPTAKNTRLPDLKTPSSLHHSPGSVRSQCRAPTAVENFASPTQQNTDEIPDGDSFSILPPAKLEEGLTKGNQILDGLEAALSKHASFEALDLWLADFEEMRTISKCPKTVIGVVGSTGSGKSSIINAILGEECLIPTSCVRACTAVVTEISHNSDSNFPYRAEVEFISKKDWLRELESLFGDLIDENGRINTELKQKESEAGIAFAKLAAVYPFLKQQDLLTKSPTELANHANVSEMLGTTRGVQSQTADGLYEQVQKYVDSKEKVDMSQPMLHQGLHSTSNIMETWPLIRVVRLFVKSEALATGSVLVDLPGSHDANQARAAVAQNYMRSCASIWVVAPIIRALDDKSARTLLSESFKRQLRLDGNVGSVTFVCSKTDEIKVSEAHQSLSLTESFAPLDNRLNEISQEVKVLRTELYAFGESMQNERNEKKTITRQLKWYTDHKKEIVSGGIVYPPVFPDENPNQVHGQTSPKKQRRITDLLENGDRDVEVVLSDIAEDLDSPPLTKETLSTRVSLLKAKKEKSNSQVKTLNAQVTKCKASIKSLITEEKSIHNEKWLACVLRRNDYCRLAMREQFAEGIRDIDNEISEEADPENFDPSAERRNYDEVAQNLPVFCVSSSAYHKLQDRLQEDRVHHAFTTVNETQVPQLKEHCLNIGQVAKNEAAVRFLCRLNQLLTELRIWAHGDKSSDKLPTPKSRVEKELLEKDLEVLIQDLSHHAQSMVTELVELVDNYVFITSLLAVDQAKGVAQQTVSKWAGKYDQGGLRYSTYKATVRRDGRFKDHDFNMELVKPLIQHLTPHWTRAFQQDIPKAFKNETKICENLLSQFKGKISSSLDIRAASLNRHKALKDLTSAYQQTQRDIFKDALTEVKQGAKTANRCFVQAIDNAMSMTYGTCAAESGLGCLMRMRATMMEGMMEHKDEMFQESIEHVQELLKTMLLDVGTRLIQALEQHAVKMRRGYAMFLSKQACKLVEDGKDDTLAKEALDNALLEAEWKMESLFEEHDENIPHDTTHERDLTTGDLEQPTIKLESAESYLPVRYEHSAELPVRPSPVPQNLATSSAVIRDNGTTDVNGGMTGHSPSKRKADVLMEYSCDSSTVDSSDSSYTDSET